MLFKMILDAAKDDERAIARGFLKHIVVGIGAGFALGSAVLVALFLIFAKLDLHVPVVFMAAAILQFGPIGGLIGAGIHLSRITDRSAPEDEGDDDEPDGGTKAAVTPAPRAPQRPFTASLAPSPA
ncbi:hypothetical protein [Hyphomonas sp.]|jgi:hypothetical protein|uniref:hypothetical protein n=1 Tax=Hyphomonas sp. TaxID=87 RepID=UPI0025BAAA55|nr:hypothetical protein [Hyphomonas sp.]MBI1400389.1 hypothetical protein [Hyphomonas sp.]